MIQGFLELTRALGHGCLNQSPGAGHLWDNAQYRVHTRHKNISCGKYHMRFAETPGQSAALLIVTVTGAPMVNRSRKIMLDLYENGFIPTLSAYDVAAAWVVAVIVILGLVLAS